MQPNRQPLEVAAGPGTFGASLKHDGTARGITGPTPERQNEAQGSDRVCAGRLEPTPVCSINLGVKCLLQGQCLAGSHVTFRSKIQATEINIVYRLLGDR